MVGTIKQLVVKSFKSLVDVDIAVGSVNVFVGANGTGKSSLLEAIGIIGAAAQGRIDDSSLRERGVRLGLPTRYLSAFSASTKGDAIILEAIGERARYEVGLFAPTSQQSGWLYGQEVLLSDQSLVVKRSRDGSSVGAVQNLDLEAGYAALKAVELEPSTPASQLLKDLRAYAVFAPSTPVLRGVEADPVQRPPIGLGGGRLPEAFDELLTKHDAGDESAFDVFNDILPLIDWAKDIETVPASEAPLSRAVPQVGRTALLFHDRFMRDDDCTLTAYDASEGALYVLFAAVMAAHPRSPFMFGIDNFDHGMNPRLAKRLTQCFTSWVLHFNRQAFLTAHSPQVLDGLPLDDPRVRLFTLDRTTRGRTVVNAIDVERVLDEKAKNEGATLSQQWLSGVLGGMPGV